MTCSDFLKELTDYLDGAMDAQTQAELEDHLQWCHNCYVVCNTTKMTIEIYRDSQLYELPDDLRGRLRSAIMSKCQSHKGNCAERIWSERLAADEVLTLKIFPPQRTPSFSTFSAILMRPCGNTATKFRFGTAHFPTKPFSPPPNLSS